MDSHQFSGSDDRDLLTTPEFCDECEMDPCVCAEIESGARCPKCRQPNTPGPYGGYSTCGDCFGGAEPDGEAFRDGEAAAYERDQLVLAQRLK